MKNINPQEFNQFLSQEIRPLVDGIKETKFFNKNKILYGAALFLCSMILAVLISNPILVFGFSLFSSLRNVSFVFVLYYVFKGYYDKKSAQDFVRAEIIQKIIKLIDPKFQYTKKFIMNFSLFSESKILGEPDRCSTEDRIFGIYNSTEFWLCQAHAEKKVTTYSKNGSKQTHWVSLFNGLIFVAEFNKELKGHTVIKQENSLGFLSFLEMDFSSLGDLVRLENPEFEKKFKVQSTDQIEARYVLTPDFMERIVDLTNSKQINPSFAFYGNKMVMFIPKAEDFIDHQMSWESVESSVHNMIREIQFFITIIDDLNLNQKLWK